MPENENRKNGGRRIVVILLAVCILASMCSVGFITYKANRVLAALEGEYGEVEDVNAEDDVVIADEYKIVSTTQISDAYLSGDASALSDRDKETLDMAKEVLDKIIEDGMNDYEKEKAVYLFLTKNLKNDTGLLTVIPTTGEDADNPHGVLKNREAVCVGYATTFRLFMQMLGIECKVIHSSDRIHSWDLVKLDDEWYHVDCYNDSDSGNFQNFNMNDTVAMQSHEWTTEFFPEATGEKYSPAMQNRKELKDIYAIPACVRSMIEDRKAVASFTFKDKIDEETEQAAGMLVSSVQETIGSMEEYQCYPEMIWTQDDNGEYVLQVYINYYDEEEDVWDVDIDTLEKIENAVEAAFGGYVEGDRENEDTTEFEMENCCE